MGNDLIEPYSAILLDLDGTLYRGDRRIDGAPEAVNRIRASGRFPVFLTNNSSRSRDEIARKLQGMGIEATPDEVVSSAVATARTLAKRGIVTAFGACGRGLVDEMRAAGIDVLEDDPDAAEVVVVGFDPETTYAKLRRACLLVQHGAVLVASNTDVAFPAQDGLWPGAGALLSVITQTTGVEAEVIGKPQAPLFETALQIAGGGNPLVVGDRIDTDIAGADALGWDSLLVLTGITSSLAKDDRIRPTWVASDVMGLFAAPQAP